MENNYFYMFMPITSRNRWKILKEALEQHRHLVRFFTNLVSAVLRKERERADGEFSICFGVNSA